MMYTNGMKGFQRKEFIRLKILSGVFLRDAILISKGILDLMDDDTFSSFGEDSDEDQPLESSHVGSIIEGYSAQYFFKEAKDDDISSPMIQEGSTLENKYEGALKIEV